jgi:D,D-heptose 1,7-bisphosphate phosphatase
MKPAIFLDRDGTIINDKGTIGDIKQVEFYPYTFDCLRQLQKTYLLFIATNQPGIAQGIILEEQVEKVNLFIQDVLKNQGIKIQEIYFCPHQKSDNCECRKPKKYFLEKAKKEYLLDMRNSYMVGDHQSDAELAINSGAKGIFVLTGHGRSHYKDLSEHVKGQAIIKLNLEFATKEILKQ